MTLSAPAPPPFLPHLDPHFPSEGDTGDTQTQGDPKKRDLFIPPVPKPF